MAWYVGIEEFNYISHHGIKGQRWGIRRYQNEDGSLTPAGRERYLKDVEEGTRETEAGYLRYKSRYNDEGHFASQTINKGRKDTIDRLIKENTNRDEVESLHKDFLQKNKRNGFISETFNLKKNRERNEAQQKYEKAAKDYVDQVMAVSNQYIKSIPKKDRDEARAYVYEYMGWDW